MTQCPGFTETGKGVVTQSEEIASGNKRAIKKFFHRLKESVGIVERTQFSKKLSETMEHFDQYKVDYTHRAFQLCLDHLSDALYTATQENGRFRTAVPKLELAPPPKEDQYEVVASCLTDNKTFEDYRNHKQQVTLYEKQAIEHREYLRRARRALHNIRTFVQHDYWVIALQRTELDSLRSEMDFAKADLAAEKEEQLAEQKRKIYKKAADAYEQKLAEVTSSMNDFPKHRKSHVADVLEWAKCTRSYHDKMAKLLGDDVVKKD
ncbi:hypothetical protein DICVIV_00214 [Dictyocaulus viviparus]|uniref:BAR domain-containing protein n=1 Tax=Dictyocaulus viviparus TaxID=29172 RepID=A0A0D8Y9F0_DICVI|nr:hypothetical protein DICVIV_00214 [Dictyocaulus viviparus]